MKSNRRTFIKSTAIGTTGIAIGGLGMTAKSYGRIIGANDRIQVGVVGFSNRVKGALIPAFMNHKDELNFDIVAISDIWNERRDSGQKFLEERMGHPIIHPKKMIPNNFSMEGVCQTIIITGANMSGKSTFLRTIGVNMVLGMSGAPVCAHKMKFKPVVVFSNMRTTDSLFDDESYFFAELKRLKFILDEVDKGKEMLIILDEILKGTNSVDKLYGSQKLVQRMVSQKCTTIIATHDLKLTEIEKEFPQEISNRCFEITIENDEMQFDYQLRDGVTTIMNASFLMKKMGIIQ